MKKENITAITSKELETSIGNILRNKRETYYLAYRIGIETGMAMMDIIKLKVADIKDKQEIVVPVQRASTENKRVATISEQLFKDIKNHISNMNKTDDDYLLTNGKGQKLQMATIQNALNSALAQIKDIDTSKITVLSLKKTFLYNQLKKGVNINDIRREYYFTSKAKLCESIGINASLINKDGYLISTDLDVSAESVDIQKNEDYFVLAKSSVSSTIDRLTQKYQSGLMDEQEINITNDFLANIFILCKTVE